jgi:hypothetical protein
VPLGRTPGVPPPDGRLVLVVYAHAGMPELEFGTPRFRVLTGRLTSARKRLRQVKSWLVLSPCRRATPWTVARAPTSRPPAGACPRPTSAGAPAPGRSRPAASGRSQRLVRRPMARPVRTAILPIARARARRASPDAYHQPAALAGGDPAEDSRAPCARRVDQADRQGARGRLRDGVELRQGHERHHALTRLIPEVRRRGQAESVVQLAVGEQAATWPTQAHLRRLPSCRPAGRVHGGSMRNVDPGNTPKALRVTSSLIFRLPSSKISRRDLHLSPCRTGG